MTKTPWRGRMGEFTRNATPTKPVVGDWTPPTGDTQLLVRVGRNELTCLNCGETFGTIATPVAGESAFCWCCGNRDGVPTISLLRPNEYEEVR